MAADRAFQSILFSDYSSVVTLEFNLLCYPAADPNEASDEEIDVKCVSVGGRSRHRWGRFFNNRRWRCKSSISDKFATAAISNSPPAGAPSGRFQMLIIPPNSNSYGPNDVVILDTQEGDLWKWYQYGGYPNSPENSSAIMYLGRAKPGEKPGDVVDKYVHPATPVSRSK